MNSKDRRHPTFETIPPFHGRSNRHERQFISDVRKRRTAPSVYSRLPIRANKIMQRQIGCRSLHPVIQFRWLNTNKLGREPRPSHPFNQIWMMCIGMSLTQLDPGIRPQTNSPPRFGLFPRCTCGQFPSKYQYLLEILRIAEELRSGCNTEVLQLAPNSISCAEIISSTTAQLPIKGRHGVVPKRRRLAVRG